jgi:FkbM family methyltransferase
VTIPGHFKFVGYSKNVVRFTWAHPANRGRRLRAVYRAVRFQVRGRLLNKPTLAPLGNRSHVWALPHRVGASMVLYANPPNYPEMLAWRRVLRPGDIFVDVGSNIGAYAIWAAEQGADVIALEPALDTFELLRRNIALNGYRVEAIQAAAGAASGSARFTSGRDCGNRLDPGGSVEVPIVTLDAIIGGRTVAGLKIDVEGFELDVLLGCGQALSEQRIKLVQLEWNRTSQGAAGTDRRPVADLLASYGYRLYRPDGYGELAPLADLSFGPDVFACPHR